MWCSMMNTFSDEGSSDNESDNESTSYTSWMAGLLSHFCASAPTLETDMIIPFGPVGTPTSKPLVAKDFSPIVTTPALPHRVVVVPVVPPPPPTIKVVRPPVSNKQPEVAPEVQSAEVPQEPEEVVAPEAAVAQDHVADVIPPPEAEDAAPEAAEDHADVFVSPEVEDEDAAEDAPEIQVPLAEVVKVGEAVGIASELRVEPPQGRSPTPPGSNNPWMTRVVAAESKTTGGSTTPCEGSHVKATLKIPAHVEFYKMTPEAPGPVAHCRRPIRVMQPVRLLSTSSRTSQ